MILPFIYLAFILGWAVLFFAYLLGDWPIKSIVSLYFMVLGMDVLINGIEGLQNIAITAFGSVHIGVAAYIILTESYQLYKDM